MAKCYVLSDSKRVFIELSECAVNVVLLCCVVKTDG